MGEYGDDIPRFVVLGHSGFIGAPLCARLRERLPREVVGLSSVQCDLTNPKAAVRLATLLDQHTTLIVCSGIKKQHGDSLELFSKNLLMASNLCRVLEAHTVRRILYLSSAEVYGEEKENLQICEATPVAPTSFYGIAKYASERLLAKAAASQGTPLLVLRPPLVYGAGDATRGYGPSGFVRAAARGESVTLWGDGSELRATVYIDDLVEMICRLAETRFEGVLNLSWGPSASFREILQILGELVPGGVRHDSRPRTKPQVDHGYRDDLLRSLIPDFCGTPLASGVRQTLDAVRQEERDMTKNRCALCGKPTLTPLLNLGPQPICNRFLSHGAAEAEFRHPLVLGYCPDCDLAQLVDPVPAAQLAPPFDWISYNEPEGHLDGLTELLAALPGMTEGSRVGAVSFKDDTTLARLERLGLRGGWRIDPAGDLGIDRPGAGVETIQDRLTPERAAAIAERYGRADLLIVRHILEHAHDLASFVASLKTLTAPEGYLVLEVPDCSRAFAGRDYTTLWEEHPIYFTPDSFRRLCERCGFQVLQFLCYPYGFENSLVAVLKTGATPGTQPETGQGAANPSPPAGEQLVAGFAADFPAVRDRVRSYLAGEGKVALFGAGHLACTYLNLFDLAELVEFVADDNPHKQGLLMPGSRVPILRSAALLEDGINLALLSLSPEIEELVIGRNAGFSESGGSFASIFPFSRHALQLSQREQL